MRAQRPQPSLSRLATAAILAVGLLTWTAAAVSHAQMVPAPPPLNGDRNRSRPPTRNIEGELPEQYKGAGVTQKLEAQLPLDATFVDSTGKTVQLGDYFDGERPMLVNMAYYECPALCPAVWSGMVASFGNMRWTPGEEFEVLTISVSDSETPEQAREKKQELIDRLGRPEAAEGWHFLTGETEQIARVAEAIGFGYKPVPQKQSQFAHEAAIMVLSPDGRVMRYLGGVKFPASTLRLSMVEATEGKVGSLMDQIAMFCSHYDPSSNTYVWAKWVMRAGGGLTLVVLGSAIAVMVKVGRRRRAAMLAAINGD
ncbi:MAG: SCO family protein [bacterium]